MNVLVTGGAGYIGSHTSHKLVEEGHRVVVLDNLSTGNKWAVPKKAEFIFGNAGDGKLVGQLISKYEIEAVVHFAAHLLVGESVERPLKYYLNNTVNSIHLVKTIADFGINKFIFSSTAAVYGQPAVVPIGEESATQPINPYGHSKLSTEYVLEDVARSMKNPYRYAILRYFNVAGAAADGKNGQAGKSSTHLIKIAAETAIGLRKEMQIFGTDYPTEDGTCIRDYVHVDDLAQAHIDALEYLSDNGRSGVFNCGYGRGFSVREVLETMQRVCGVNFVVQEGPRRSGDPPELVAQADKIQRLIRWKPQFDDLEVICRSAYEWEATLQKKKAA